jgi:hypothetical protein
MSWMSWLGGEFGDTRGSTITDEIREVRGGDDDDDE